GTISSFQGKVRGGLFQFESFADSYTSYQYSCTYEGDLNHGLDEALSHLNLVGKSTCKVNEFGLPTLMVTNYNFTPTERRTQNFYKLFKPGSGNTAEMTNLSDCRVIHELHPECRYFDLSGHQVSGRMGLTQYLIEKGPTGTNRVLFIEE
ncbi:MAG TPA: hypothetical protein VJ508_10640, partial [Saprospiraceae bacterium]|nr:hypothetical protein [Saprospiraceae bacterium]